MQHQDGTTLTFWLSMHASYACRDAGACCSSGWPIPIERTKVAVVAGLRQDSTWLQPAPGAPPDVAGVLATSPDGRCVFRDHGCAIHRAVGHQALPTACQHFPREVLIDRRGVFVTLSHYCPTAADLLFEGHGPVTIVTGPPAVPDGHPEGLDARDVLPPLLAPGVLMDDEGYAAWEAHMVHRLTWPDAQSPEEALTALSRDLTALQRWRPEQGPLSAAVEQLRVLAPDAPVVEGGGAWDGSAVSAVMRRFLAARAFASWMAYQGGGVVAVLGHLHLNLATLRTELGQRATEGLPSREALKEAIRATDLRLLHLTDRDELARRLRASQA